MATQQAKRSSRPTSVTFLGTSSGGGPIVSRNCSSLALNLDGSLWQGTQLQLQQSKLKMGRITRIFITHMHADHTLGIVPLLGTLMTGVGMKDEDYLALRELGMKKKAKINIYGPPGLRSLLRQTLTLTRLSLSSTYAVHELLPHLSSSSHVRASCACEYQAPDPATLDGWMGDTNGLHVNEAPGRDLVADRDGCWRDLVGKCETADEEADEPETEVSAAASTAEAGTSGTVTPGGEAEPRKRTPRRKAGASTPLWRVDAGPIEHRIPSMGYIISEPPQYLPLDTAILLPLLEAEREALAALPEPITNPRSILSRLTSTRQRFTLPSGLVLDPPPLSTEATRKIVIMGDCAGVSNDAFEDLAREPSLLVHECTNAWIDPGVEKGEKGARVRTAELDKTIRSTPASAGTNNPGTPGGQPASGATETAGPVGEEWIKMEQERVRRILAAKAVVEHKARSRGHSTPDMVGAFARRIGARRVALNHFSAMFPSPHYATDVPFPSLLMETSHHSPGRPLPPIAISELHRRVLMSFIESQTTDAWHPVGGVRATASRDLMTYDIPSHELTDEEVGVIIERTNEADKFQDLWRHEGATGITRAFGIRVAGLDKSISGMGYGHLRPPATEAREDEPRHAEGEGKTSPAGTSVTDSEKASRGKRTSGRGKRGTPTAGRGGRGATQAPGQGRPPVTYQQPENGSAISGPPPRKRGHARAKSTAA
ncbi:hypothetical protein QFC21_005751 [Naganishia friedmannii]|uniref:Uncharacterized protein n=1 Tax=Naganishia friedmannii TaxID=89922 RepID=A0ACC2V6I2_9TREE|nr:hypothetical protein QFC21_005751 [Naganishia friedmannii]